MVELNFRKKTEEKAQLLGLENNEEEAREETGVEGSKVCVLIIHLPFKVASGGMFDGGGCGSF